MVIGNGKKNGKNSPPSLLPSCRASLSILRLPPGGKNRGKEPFQCLPGAGLFLPLPDRLRRRAFRKSGRPPGKRGHPFLRRLVGADAAVPERRAVPPLRRRMERGRRPRLPVVFHPHGGRM